MENADLVILVNLIIIQELNTAADFISFYEEMMPLVQTLPQVILHREKIFSELLQRLNMKARLSLEPILMSVMHKVYIFFFFLGFDFLFVF